MGLQDAAEHDAEVAGEALSAVVQVDPGDGLDAVEPAAQRRSVDVQLGGGPRRIAAAVEIGSCRPASDSSKPLGVGGCHHHPMIKRIVAYAVGDDLSASRDFYVEVLGFQVAMDDPILGVTSPANPTAQILIPPRGMQNPPPSFGVDVGDPDAVDAAHAEAVHRGLRVVYPLTNEPWGVRRFFVEDPGGTVVNVLAHLA